MVTELDSPDPPVAFQAGDQLDVTIEDIAFGGEGVARVDNFVVFVPFVIAGEKVRVELTEVKKNFARARLAAVESPSPDRVRPECPVFGECGGCQYQHVRYAEQLKIKHKQVRDLFERVGGFEGCRIDPVVPCPTPYHYRNRIMVRSQWDKFKKRINVGFLRHDSRLVVDVEECKIAEHRLNQDLQVVRQNPPRKNGVKSVLRMFPEGWVLPNDSFFQNNFHLLPKLIETVAERLHAGGIRHLIDAYCGVGFFSLELAPKLESFVGVEVDRMAIRAAKQNAENRAVTNGEFIEGRTEALLPDLLKQMPPERTALILDPPRKGCDKAALEVVKQVRPAKVIYISCHPATLARDLNLLCSEQDYHLEKVIPLDMFPQTRHVECVADLKCLKGNDA